MNHNLHDFRIIAEERVKGGVEVAVEVNSCGLSVCMLRNIVFIIIILILALLVNYGLGFVRLASLPAGL